MWWCSSILEQSFFKAMFILIYSMWEASGFVCSITLEGKVDPIQPLFEDTPIISLQLSTWPKISYGSGQTTEIVVGDVDRVGSQVCSWMKELVGRWPSSNLLCAPSILTISHSGRQRTLVPRKVSSGSVWEACVRCSRTLPQLRKLPPRVEVGEPD